MFKGTFGALDQQEKDPFCVKMLVNKNYKNITKGQALDVVTVEFTGSGKATFAINNRNGERIPERYLDVITKELNPEYYL